MLSNERSIVVGVDGSEGARLALKWAADEARLRDLVLRIVCAGTPHPGEFCATFDVFHLSAAGKVVEEAVGLAASRHPDVIVRGEPATGPPAEALLAASQTADLLVVGARGAGGFLGLRLGSVSRRCLRRATRPVAVVHSHPADPAELRTGRIVVGIDGSEGSHAALRWAVEEAERREATVAAVFAWQYGPVGSYLPMPKGGYEAAARRVVEAAKVNALQWRPGVPVEAVPMIGSTVTILMNESGRADVLVVGQHGRSHLQELLVGSTADECAHYAYCPVVVVPQQPSEGDSTADGKAASDATVADRNDPAPTAGPIAAHA